MNDPLDDPRDLSRRLIDTALRLAAERGWKHTTLFDIAAETGVSLVEVYRLFPTRGALLAGLFRRVDAEVLVGTVEVDAEETVRDRLFDVLMRRFDALEPCRPGIAAIVRDLRADPFLVARLWPAFIRSMAWMLRAAGVDPAGASGLLQAGGLGTIYLTVLRVWLDDDTPDKARTMAALDARLRRLEGVMGGFRG
ncbi:MAG TPA: TetR/AcrR family transcriptional regulator [Azospirillaceae bacterium]|nr:TetR/AcrR family transcriptional regulator [Azospirillaceae bacterium]